MPQLAHVVVLGASMAGLLAAAAVADIAERVTVVERDRLETGPAHRTGLPQARHAHLLWSGGARAVEQLLPGILDVLAQRGARHINVSADFVCLTAHGWLPRFRGAQYAIVGTRHLLDWTVRERVARLPRVTIRDGADVSGLTGDAGRVTGVLVRGDGGEEQIDADLVIDATGRGSRARQWLTALHVPGVDTVREQVIDSGLTYATQIFEAPAGAGDFPLVSVQADIPTRGPGLAAGLLPVEDGRWLVTAAGTRGHAPPSDEAGFRRFLRTRMRHPIIADLVAGLQPTTPIYTTHSTANRRLHVEQVSGWPDGFVAIADAVASFNPIYGQGMSVAARSCLTLREGLQRGVGPGSGRRLQRGMAGIVQGAWNMATGVDVFYPHDGRGPTAADRFGLAYVNRVVRAALDRQDAAEAFFEVLTMNAPPTRLTSPRMLLAAVRRRPALSAEAIAAVPLTGVEFAAAGLGADRGQDRSSPG